MRLLGKHILDLVADDILYLKNEGIPESRTLDYKLQLPEHNKELLADIIAFANTDGGIIIYGIEEKMENGKNTGYPGEIKGLGPVNIDIVKQRIENALRDCIDPRLSNIVFQQLEIEGSIVLIVGIPRSLFAPHMVRTDSKFYGRNGSGKFAMDTQQIRQAFMQTADWEKQANDFRLNRISEFISGRNKYLNVEKAVFLHIIPLGSK